MAITASSARKMDDHNVTTFPNSVNTNNRENNNNNYNNYLHARACKERLADIGEVYYEVFGRAMPRFVTAEVESMIARGLSVGMIKSVLEYTACAPRPSWAYARAVLYRNEERGIKDEFAFADSLYNRGRDGCELPY